MIIGVPKEANPKERRVPIIPQTGQKLIGLGADLIVEQGMGLAAGFTDHEYEDAGGKILKSNREILGTADVILRLNKPTKEDVKGLKAGCIHISYLDPFNERRLVKRLAENQIQAISMEMIPRSTRAQKLDALSSQANHV